MIRRSNIMVHEFIGLVVEVEKSPDRKMVGMRGKVVDETKNTLLIETEKGEKRIQKAGTVFLFTLPNNEKAEVEGKVIACRPEDRPKKLARLVKQKG